VIVTTDRQSAFDRLLAAVPFKGAVLNQTSAWWMARTAHIVPNALLVRGVVVLLGVVRARWTDFKLHWMRQFALIGALSSHLSLLPSPTSTRSRSLTPRRA
jgi:phosphoribosylaminoimidazole-succinocarboxamide synthase